METLMEEFRGFQKISRLSRECIITEKIDGTNASVFITEDGQFLTGSRTHWIQPEADNFGFSRWAHEHKDELLTLGPGHHFGEWWGHGIQRGYGLPKGERRFLLFNTAVGLIGTGYFCSTARLKGMCLPRTAVMLCLFSRPACSATLTGPM